MTSLNSKLQLALLNRKKGRNLIEKGFTLVELMIVIVIVGILSAVALPNFLNQTNKARATEAQSQVSAAFKNATALYLEDPNINAELAATDGSCGADLKLVTSDSVTAYECDYTAPDLTITATISGGGTVEGAINLTTGVVTKPEFTGG